MEGGLAVATYGGVLGAEPQTRRPTITRVDGHDSVAIRSSVTAGSYRVVYRRLQMVADRQQLQRCFGKYWRFRVAVLRQLGSMRPSQLGVVSSRIHLKDLCSDQTAMALSCHLQMTVSGSVLQSLVHSRRRSTERPAVAP